MARVWINDLQVGMILEKDLYDTVTGGIPLLRRGAVISKDFLDKLRQRGVFAVYIRDPRPVRKIARVPELLVPKAKPVLTRKLQTEALTGLETFFQEISLESESPVSATVIGQLDKVVDQLVDTIGADQSTLININDLKSYDEYTYHHSLSVAVLAISIGQHLQFSRDELRRLGRAAIMHDIGKTAVPLEIINKPARLSDEEFAVMKGHSAAGYDYLLKRGIGDEALWQAVLDHHEKTDGSGYPNGLVGNQIPVFSRIISVADVFDALTSQRPYRNPMEPADAMEYVMGGVGTFFDYDIVSAFTKKVSLYPVGSFVELSNGQICVVVNNEYPMRPIVRPLDSGDFIDLARDHHCLNLVISRILHGDESLALRKKLLA